MTHMDMINKKNRFSLFILISALGLAGVAAYFSIIGIASLFSGAALSVGIMALFLEIGKICSVSFVYRFWDKINKLYKSYFILAVFILTILTSSGIGSFLLAYYQSASLGFKLNQEKIVTTESSKGYYTNQVQSAEERIKMLNDVRKIQESRLSEALTNAFLSRNVIQLQQLQQQTIKLIDQADLDIKSENNKIEQARTQMQTVDEKVNQMKIGAIEKKDIQTFRFLAEALHTDLDTVAKWFIISLIFVFDPLAIALILAYNVVVYKKEDETILDKPIVSTPKVVIKKVEPTIEIPTTPIIVEQPTQVNIPTEVVKNETPLNNITPPPNSGVLDQMSDYYRRLFKH